MGLLLPSIGTPFAINRDSFCRQSGPLLPSIGTPFAVNRDSFEVQGRHLHHVVREEVTHKGGTEQAPRLLRPRGLLDEALVASHDGERITAWLPRQPSPEASRVAPACPATRDRRPA